MIKVFIKLYLPEIVFSGFFLFVYLPHFIFIGTPQILHDSYAYLFVAKDIVEGNLPLENYIIDLPTGYSLFIALIKSLGGDLASVMLVQTSIFFASFLFLVHQVKKISWFASLSFGVIIALFVTLSDVLLMNTLIYTEALFTSFIALLTAFLVKYFPKYPKKLAVSIFICTVFIILLRSNGFFILFLPAILFTESVFSKRKHKSFFLIALLANILVSSLINIPMKGYFAPGEFNRFHDTRAVKHMVRGEFMIDKEDVVVNPKNKEVYTKGYIFNQAYKAFFNSANPIMGNHYYYRMGIQYRKYDYSFIMHTLATGDKFSSYLDRKVPDLKEYADFIIDDVPTIEKEQESVLKLINFESKPRNLWLVGAHLVHLSRQLIRNPILPILFYFSFFLSLYKSIKNFRDPDNKWKLISLISLIHITSMLLYSVYVLRDEMLQRYCLVTEFTEYIVIVLSFSYLITQYRLSKRKTN